MDSGKRVAAPLLMAIYAVGAFAVVVAFAMLLPGEKEPLAPFGGSWRFFRGVLSYVSLFPAIALSAIAGAFGFGAFGGRAEDRFDSGFMEEMRPMLLTVIAAAAFYALLFLFARPMARDALNDMAAKSVLFKSAAAKADSAIAAGDLREASGYLAVCQRVWPNSPLTEEARESLTVETSSERAELSGKGRSAQAGKRPADAFPGVSRETTANGALAAARKAYREKHYYDAHWYATLAERIADGGAPEKAEAARLGADAWNAIAKTEPSGADKRAFSVFKRKREGYAAILAENWIKAYYIYEKLAEEEPEDPDVDRFGKISEEGVSSVSFFADEVGASIGAVDFDVFLSVPRDDGGRDVLRVRRLHPFADAAYGEGFELLSFGKSGKRIAETASDYVKIVPFRVEREDGPPLSRTAFLMLALDRDDENKRWGPRWKGAAPPGPGTRVVLDAAYDDLLLAAKARKGADRLSLPELNRAIAALPPFGYIAETLRAEIMRRLSEPFAFLSLSIFVLAIAWRSRARKSAGAGGVLVLLILPFSMNVLAHGYRLLSSTASTLFAAALPVSASLAAVLAFHTALLILALVFLAGQRA